MCGKKCKSKSGLKRHTNAKHGHTTNSSGSICQDGLTTHLLSQIVEETALKLSKNACYPKTARDELASYCLVLGEDTCEMKMMQKLYREYQKKGNVEKFYTQYFSEVPPKATRYFPGLAEKTATFLATKVADHMLFLAKKDKNSVDVDQSGRSRDITSTTNTILSEREYSGGQYLGGYVFHNLNKKLKNSPKWKSPEYQQAISVLEAARTTDIDDQKLVSCLNRGGLWAINANAQVIIFKTENLFRDLTTSINENKVDVNTILFRSLSHPDILSAFDSLIANSELKPEKQVAKDILHSIVYLYIKVRAFSLAKDFVQKYKLAAKSKLKQKALRKDIQRAIESAPEKNIKK